MIQRRRPPWTAWVLLLAGALCLAQGLSKGFLWVAGTRTTGYISFQENTVSSRGATWVRYRFTTAAGQPASGTAMTAAKGSVFTRVQILYLPFLPAVNMPAYGGYAALLGGAWSGAGLLLLGLSRLFPRQGRRKAG